MVRQRAVSKLKDTNTITLGFHTTRGLQTSVTVRKSLAILKELLIKVIKTTVAILSLLRKMISYQKVLLHFQNKTLPLWNILRNCQLQRRWQNQECQKEGSKTDSCKKDMGSRMVHYPCRQIYKKKYRNAFNYIICFKITSSQNFTWMHIT